MRRSPTRREFVTLLRATGLKLWELERLRVEQVDIRRRRIVGVQGSHFPRDVPVLPEGMRLLSRLVKGRRHDERLFEQLPSGLAQDARGYRLHYARSLYRELSGGKLPSRIRSGLDLDRDSLQKVADALGTSTGLMIGYYLTSERRSFAARRDGKRRKGGSYRS